jgi:uncharacterized phage protein gp47/JayE
MTTYGATPTGFLRKPVRAILADIEAVQRAEISPNLDLSSSSMLGQVNGIVANEIGIAWEQLDVCYHAFDPDAAQDFLLTSLGKLTGTERRAASHSLVTLHCELDAGTTLEAGVHYAAVDGDAESLWTPVADYTADTDNTHEVQFRAVDAGPIPGQVGTITVIHTAVVGWHSVTNTEEAQLGRTIDSDTTLRTRREAQLTATGSATIDAIRSDVLEVEGVESVDVFENDSDETVDGLPPHSIEVLVFDGETSTADSDAIAQAIWNTRAAGVQTVGSVSGTAYDARGAARTMNFSRPDVKDVYISITLETTVGYPGDAAVAEYIAAQARALHGVGDDVRVRRVDSLVFGLTGIVDVAAFTLGFSASPVGTANLTIEPREIASFDASRIVVTS